MMYSGSIASPEDVACYEECITDEIYLPSPPSPSASASPRDVPKSSSSGRVTKRGEQSDRNDTLVYTYLLAAWKQYVI